LAFIIRINYLCCLEFSEVYSDR